jgi:hypothetical protein
VSKKDNKNNEKKLRSSVLIFSLKIHTRPKQKQEAIENIQIEDFIIYLLLCRG